MPAERFLIHFVAGVVAVGYRMVCLENRCATLPKAATITYRSNPDQGAGVGSDSVPGNWQLRREEDGIRVYVKENQNGYLSVRLELSMRASVATLRHRLKEVDRYPEWIYRCTSAVRLSPPRDSLLMYRVITDFPFPFRDRSLTVWSTQHTDTLGTFRSRSSAVVSATADDDYVTIHYFEGRWQATSVSAEVLSVTYEVVTEPGGNIPVWLYNLAVDEGPFRTMKNLRSLIEGDTFASQR